MIRFMFLIFLGYVIWILAFSFPGIPSAEIVQRKIDYSLFGFIREQLLVLLLSVGNAVIIIYLTKISQSSSPAKFGIACILVSLLSILEARMIFILTFVVS